MNEQERLIDEATYWFVRINSGDASPAEHQGFVDWRARDPRHEQVCARLEATLGQALRAPLAQGVGSQALQRALGVPSSRRKVLRQALLFGGLALGAGMLGSRVLPVAELMADLRTGTGERRTVTLADGSQLILNARSAVDVAFAEDERRVRLLGGEVLVRAAGAGPRPLVIATPFGEALVKGHDVLVRHQDERSEAVSLNASVALRALEGQRLSLGPRQAVRFGAQGFGPISAAQGTESAWVDGLLEVHDRPLREVVEAFRPYRNGVVRIDPAIAGLRVSGLFRLDNSDLILEALVRTLPIRVNRLTDLWVTLEAA